MIKNFLSVMIMWSDLIYLISIPLSLIFSNLTLKTIGLNNKIIVLTVFFVLIHLQATYIFYQQISTFRTDSKVLSNREIAGFVGFVLGITAVFLYLLISYFPGLKSLLRPLNLPDGYIDLTLLTVPLIGLNVLARKLISL